MTATRAAKASAAKAARVARAARAAIAARATEAAAKAEVLEMRRKLQLVKAGDGMVARRIFVPTLRGFRWRSVQVAEPVRLSSFFTRGFTGRGKARVRRLSEGFSLPRASRAVAARSVGSTTNLPRPERFSSTPGVATA